ncbi:hypothetical protein KZE55_09045 [Limosilactobacillus panis]|uniref:hypothetical protein n=1 Tax=Limosilactobacillus panis TaxID=47493 RepID=UPI001C9563C6|nr:hypothetical protein [Limosilactobacillus panis]QZN92889.1 hypothetical protein KZE55_09045 [Limosilactobacillus panis]
MANSVKKFKQGPYSKPPLVLVPMISLAWAGGWMTITSAWQASGRILAPTQDLQESILLLSVPVLIANIYNLLLIYNQPAIVKQQGHYQALAIVNAVVMIAALVLAWGAPGQVLAPARLTVLGTVFLALTSIQALLGNYFAQVTRLTSPLFIPLPLGSGALIVASYLLALVTANHGVWQRGLIIICLGALAILLIAVGKMIPRMWAPLVTRRSGTYQFLAGLVVTATLVAALAGTDSFVTYWAGGYQTLLILCLANSLVAATFGLAILAAMQRYQNDYRYGKAARHPYRYVLLGCLTFLLALLMLLWKF